MRGWPLWTLPLRAALPATVAGCLVVGLAVASPESTSATAGQGVVLPSAKAADDDRPNVVLITTDDQSLADTRVMRTVLRRLGERGTTYRNAFSPYPLCCPARATILTGQYAHNHHVLGNKPPYGGFSAFDDTDTLPVWLQEAGYRTAILGKYLNQYPSRDDPLYVPPGWDDWRVPIDGIYNYKRFVINHNGRERRYSGVYQTDVVADEAVDVIDSFAPRSKPFFLWAGFLAPHDGSPAEPDDPDIIYGNARLRTPMVAPRYRDRFEAMLLPAKASINEKAIADKPRYVRRDEPLKRAGLEEVNQQRRESLLSVDDAVGRILDALKKRGELDDTVVIFTSDNGFLVGEHRQTGKVMGYEESTRVPLIIAGPGFDAEAAERRQVSLADLAPTILDVSEAAPGLLQDGVSLKRASGYGLALDERPILLQAGPDRGHTSRWYTGIHTRRYVYVDYNTGEQELYDLSRDPQQLTNLAGLPSKRRVQRKLAAALTRLADCAGPSCQQSVATLEKKR